MASSRRQGSVVAMGRNPRILEKLRDLLVELRSSSGVVAPGVPGGTVMVSRPPVSTISGRSP